ncbi:DUF6155 family protein [Sporosarcina sp. ACRSM]|uniref:DUF6155 family protein n=1 Tax=Sporosarcina sp. ACRSM TaxID=2918216 RepID=UPI001EF60138|nr:DUF6155 family protein [Sporosarcina sp. ACRSM]MCG7337072.1 DUF6155 family protein [Sporosarcina sp. ACRSM]
MKLKVSELKKQLKNYDQKQLIQLIADLYKINKGVQSYLSVQLLGKEAMTELFQEAKNKVENEFFPSKSHGKLRLSEAKKAISNFKKTTDNHLLTTELMLYYVEQGVKFTNTYGDIDERFYSSMATMYEKVITICNEEDEFFQLFKGRLKKIVTDTDGIGWGFHDQLAYLYDELDTYEDNDD